MCVCMCVCVCVCGCREGGYLVYIGYVWANECDCGCKHVTLCVLIAKIIHEING